MIRDQLVSALDGGAPVIVGPATLRSPQGLGGQIPAEAALVLPTSGSTSGTGRYVWLSADALRASAQATFAALAGPGQWALVLPTDHIAGIQVVVRAILAGFTPSHGDSIADAAQGLTWDHPRYISIVPTQLVRALATADTTTIQALASMDAVLVGGAALAPPVFTQAREAGIKVVTTYGMTETAGGCVYNHQPLPGVQAKLVDGRIHLAGPMLAGGYVGDPSPEFYTEDGVRWFTTSDLGQFQAEQLHILGRADDVINTGGIKVHPAQVERQLREHLPDVFVLGLPDPEWGQIVTAVVAEKSLTLAQVREWCGGGPTSPRALITVPEFPRIGIGKLDRTALRALAAKYAELGRWQRWNAADSAP